MTEIRIAENAAEIAQLEAECFDTPWSENAAAEELALPTTAAFVLYDDDIPVGYIVGVCAYEEAELYRIGVSPRYRQRGYGKELLQKLAEECKKKSATSIFLEVRESNRPARALYEGTGFATIGIRKNYYEKPVENAVIMRKEV